MPVGKRNLSPGVVVEVRVYGPLCHFGGLLSCCTLLYGLSRDNDNTASCVLHGKWDNFNNFTFFVMFFSEAGGLLYVCKAFSIDSHDKEKA